MIKLKELRKQKGLSQKELATLFSVAQNTISQWENGERKLDTDTLIKLSEFFSVTTDYLLGNSPEQPETPSTPHPALTPKDEAEIARDLEAMLASLDAANGMAAYNEPEDEEDRELLKASLLTSMRLAKQMAKKKYTPKKYRKE